MEKGLVSVLTPCYNGAKLIHRLLNSILQQDYPNIEMIVVNDGSTDESKDVIEGYIEPFLKKGYVLTYIYQENGGQSVAINNGLKMVKGEYLIWPDCDDWYNTPSAISTFVTELCKLPEDYAEVRCIPTYVDEISFRQKTNSYFKAKLFNTNQFLNCLFSDNFLWGAGNYMLRMSAFDKVNPNREIYTQKNAGQNWQMHLPILYSYKVHTLKTSLHCVLVRHNSHSRGQYKSYKQQLDKVKSYEDTVVETIKRINEIPVDEKEAYSQEVAFQYNLIRMTLSLNFHEYRAAYNFRSFLTGQQSRIKNLLDRCYYYAVGCPVLTPVLYKLIYTVSWIISKIQRCLQLC